MSEPFEAQDELKLRPPKEKRADLKVGHYNDKSEPGMAPFGSNKFR